jgi:glycosyltransferase involved in cell wall biosynthesis
MEQSNKKRILVFLPEFPVLTETFIARDLEMLVSSEMLEVEIVALKKGAGELSPELAKHFHRSRLNIIDLFFSLKYFLLKKEKVAELKRIIQGDLTKNSWQKFYLLWKSLGYTNILKNYHPDEIHAHFYSDFSSLAMFVAIILDLPFSVSAHARDVLEYPHLPKTKAKRAKFVTVCNKNAYERLLKISQADPQKVHLIHHGLNAEKLFPEGSSKPRENGLIFMGGTRLTAKKGIEDMMAASSILKRRGIDHKVVLIGPGEDFQQWQDKIRELDLSGTFKILGEGQGAPFSQIAPYYLKADLFVLPLTKSVKGDEDGIPNAIIEAALAKAPIITTDAGSVGELIIDDLTGVVVPQKNPERLATEIEKLLFDREKKERLGNAAHHKAMEMFDQEKNIRKLESLLLL